MNVSLGGMSYNDFIIVLHLGGRVSNIIAVGYYHHCRMRFHVLVDKFPFGKADGFSIRVGTVFSLIFLNT